MQFKTKWILFTSIGWFAGIVIGLLVEPLLEVLRATALQQSLLAICVAAEVGFMQGLIVKKYKLKSSGWFWTYVTGFALAFILIELVGDHFKIRPEVYINIAAAVASLLTGWLQGKFVFRINSNKTAFWMLTTFCAWVAAILITMIFFQLNRMLEKHVAIAFAFAGVLIGGPIIGWITSSIHRLFR